MTTTIKQLTASYFAENYALIRNNYADIAMFFESDLETLKSCAIDGCWSNAMTICAISNALRISIRIVYPPHNGPQDIAYQKLNTIVEPIVRQPIKNIAIMWTGPFDGHSIFVPNHFVTCLVRDVDQSIFYIFFKSICTLN